MGDEIANWLNENVDWLSRWRLSTEEGKAVLVVDHHRHASEIILSQVFVVIGDEELECFPKFRDRCPVWIKKLFTGSDQVSAIWFRDAAVSKALVADGYYLG